MKTKLTLFILLFSKLCISQIGFQNHEITDFTESLSDFIIEDINNDGHKDIVTYGIYSIDWYENTGIAGEFKRKKTITDEVYYVTSVGILDYDNDGDLDLISTSAFDDKIAWYENINSLGDFGPQQLILTNITSVGEFYFADIDNDIDIDIINKHGAYGINWYENIQNSSTNFTTQHTINGTVSFNSIEDIDNDGDLDLYLYNNNYIMWLENLGNGSFASSEILYNANNINSMNSTQLYDLDSDGDLDIYILRFSSGPTKISYLENIGSGNFGPEQIVYQINGTYNSSSFNVNDFDNDGDTDVIISFNNNFYKIENNNGVYSGLIPISEMYLFRKSKSDDLDNDGNVDLIVQSNSSTLSLFKNINATATFSKPIIICSDTDEVSATIAADINSDGYMDIISASYDDGKISWYKMLNNNNDFTQQKIISFEADGAKDVLAADIDGDGDLDIVSISGRSSTGDIDRVSWYENIDGQGTFGPQNNILEGSYDSPDGLLVFDIDGDGDNDVLTSLDNFPNNDKIVWYENLDGLGNFGVENIISTEVDGVTKLFKADIDNDGDFDIISNSVLDSKIAWYENQNNQGQFGSQNIILSNVTSCNSIYLADIDGDSFLDIIYNSNGSIDKIYWIKNLDGLGNFGNPQFITSVASNGSTSVTIADIDNDGNNDVIATSIPAYGGSEQQKIIWMKNRDGLGTFDPLQIIYNGNFQKNLFVSDIDNDGDADILASGYNRISWNENLGITLNKIKGTVFIDLDSNGCEVGEEIPNIMITTEDNSDSFSTFTLNNPFKGLYQLFVEEGNFTTSISSELPNYFISNPTSYTSNFNSIGNTETLNFCIEPVGIINDLSISVYPNINDPRPGFNTSYKIVFKNTGTTRLDGTITFQYDATKLTFLNSSQNFSSQTSNTLTFDYTNLNLFETRSIDLNFNVIAPPTTNIGDILNTLVTINPIADDITPEDNVINLNERVIGSYDPNDITVIEGDKILLEDADKFLHYIIRFQNTGTASAINVNVINILDTKLDWRTLQIESLSHQGRIEIKNGINVNFIFDDINLPDDTSNEPDSHGYIAYKIKPKDNVVLGDTFLNTADIFFDFNPAITTNTVSTTIVNTLSNTNFNIFDFSVYPNPTEDFLNIESKDKINKIEIFDINGRVLKSLFVDNTDVKINLSNFKAGVYFIQVTDNSQKLIQKFLKK